MSGSFVNLDDVFEMLKNAGNISGPVFYGYTMTTGPDGKPVVQEYGNVKPDTLPIENKREPLIDTLVDEKENTLKIVAEMPGVEKKDVSVVVGDDKVIHIDAERGEKKYHVKVPIKHKVDAESPKATYKNGILELTFKLEDEKSKGKTIDVL
uniref:Heat shock protein (HSP20) n=1 Tax=uncultured marine thaumarchaeote KM3_56_B06 TaxID=1456201 RepID=A0A075H959_9ARCH|nr:heat shock protein (HSP20) [uncultured marine thaumarchaeote KM3_56_B06]